MMTVMIECGTDAGPLGSSLATLVPGAIEGLVREVVVIDAGLDASTRKVADHAGCRIVPREALAETVSAARGEWLMLMEPGARLAVEWIEGVAAHLADVEAGATPRPARFSPSRGDRPRFLQRLARRSTALANGLILPKAQAVGLARSRTSLEEMAKGLASKRLATAIRPRPFSARRF